jgi:hypothetical protein
MVTNAYLYDGEEKYKKWVKEYVDGWVERTRQNNGILPDNVGLSGKVGEYIDGKWYGGNYGWTWPHGWLNLGWSTVIAAENANLLFRDPAYLNLPRSQVDLLMSHGIVEDGRLLVPYKYTDPGLVTDRRQVGGWYEFRLMHPVYMAHIWSASMDPADMDRLNKLRDPNRDLLEPLGTGKDRAGHEYAWLAFQQGRFPSYPEEMMKLSHRQVYDRLAFMAGDTQDPREYGDWYLQERNPIIVEGLVSLTMGGPLTVYNGGLLMVRVRHYDCRRKRPGLPEDVAALVRPLRADRTVLELYNFSRSQVREMIVQAGGFAEHQFTTVQYETESDGQVQRRRAEVNGKHLKVRLEPRCHVTLDIGTKRFVNQPSNALPW